MTRTGLALATCAALVLLVAIVGSLIADESQSWRFPEPAGNGLIAYSYAGDIYVGDPTTGETAPIVTHASTRSIRCSRGMVPDRVHTRRSPDRGSNLVVVRADGSDERVLLPKDRQHRGFGSLAWTPEGDSLLAQLDTPPFTYPHDDGELSLFDSSGSGEEQLLTPPLAPTPGGHYFNSSIHVAPMFRPPVGDRILSGDRNALSVFDRDLTGATRLGSDALKRYEPYIPFGLTWSPTALESRSVCCGSTGAALNLAAGS